MTFRIALLFVCLACLNGCAGEDDLRAVALQSAGIASRAGQAANSFAAAQNRMNAANEQTLTEVQQRTAAIIADVNARKVGWSDSWAMSTFTKLAQSEREALPGITAAYYAPPAPPKTQIAFDNAALEKLLGLLADLGKKPSFKERAVFLARFASQTKDEFEAALAKASAAAGEKADPTTALPPQKDIKP
jgi:hypothetical protein